VPETVAAAGAKGAGAAINDGSISGSPRATLQAGDGHESFRAACAKALGTHARMAGVDLLVIGVYGHPRMLQIVLGGVTSGMFSEAELPILLYLLI
jgi:nucleotide-binding universal stress UspA family protein